MKWTQRKSCVTLEFNWNIVLWLYLLLIYCYDLAYGYFPFSGSGSCMVYMHISTNEYNGFYLATFFIIYGNMVSHLTS